MKMSFVPVKLTSPGGVKDSFSLVWPGMWWLDQGSRRLKRAFLNLKKEIYLPSLLHGRVIKITL